MEVCERFGGIVDAAAIGLVAAHRERGIAGDGQFQHLDALGGGRRVSILFVRRHGGRQEPHGVQPALLPAALRQQQVSVMNRVERSAKNAKSHGRSAFRAQRIGTVADLLAYAPAAILL